MNKTLIMASALTLALLTACNGTSATDNNTFYTVSVSIDTPAKAKMAFANLNSALSSQSKLNTQSAVKKSSSRAIQSYDCINGGNFSIDADQGNSSTTYNNCLINDYTLNGKILYTNDNSGATTLTMSNYELSSSGLNLKSNLTIVSEATQTKFTSKLNGAMSLKTSIPRAIDASFTYNNFVTTFYTGTSSTTMNGSFSVNDKISTCANGTYNIKTLSPLSETSGSVDVNGVVYTFSNDIISVTLKDGSVTTCNKEEFENTSLSCN